MHDFEGRAVLVTGAASGIGRAVSRAFAARGANLVLADIDERAGAALLDELAGSTGKAVFRRADVTSPEACEALVGVVRDQFGRLDIAVNNVGKGDYDADILTHDKPVSVWQQTLDITLSSTFYCLKAELPLMLESGGGAIVNTASTAGIIAFPNSSAYIAAKHGVIGLTKAICLEYAALGIRCNAVAPGFTRTPLLVGSGADAPSEEALAAMAAEVPQRRLAEPEEIAETVVWLASPAASFINGVCVPVDGGYVIR